MFGIFSSPLQIFFRYIVDLEEWFDRIEFLDFERKDRYRKKKYLKVSTNFLKIDRSIYLDGSID